jgi:hypothetical protein
LILRRKKMSEETRKILEMLREGKLSVEEADRLLETVSAGGAGAAGTTGAAEAPARGGRRYLRVQVEPGADSPGQERVNIRVPMKLIRAGIKLAAFLPGNTKAQVSDALREKGIDADLSKLSAQDIEELVSNLDDLTVNVEGKETVRIYAE